MNKRLLYILGIAAAMLTSCSDEVADAPSPFLNGKEKTPIIVESNISAQMPVTRAVDGSWEKDDVFVAYIKHVTTTENSNPLSWASDVTGTGVGPRLAGFKVNALTTGYTGTADNFNNHSATSTLVSTDANGLYWDDFSNSVDAAHDLRSADHALMSYYGYCYNGSPAYNTSGSSITTDLVENTGVLGWTVAAVQTSGFKTSDLLWSGSQTPVKYAHVDAEGNRNHGTLSIPFTHAMSKVTIEIELGEGFDTYQSGDKNYAKAFGTSIETSGRIATTPTLFANRETVVTAPTQTLSTTVAANDDAGIQMYLSDDEKTNPKHRVYEAIIAPTVMKAGNKLAEITVDGNKYDIVLTNDMLTTIPQGASGTAWNTQLKAYNVSSTTLTKSSPETGYDSTKGGLTLPGVHYYLTVKLNKQSINVEAMIANWTPVLASADAEIKFAADVKINNITVTEVSNTSSFDLWRSRTDAHDSYDEDPNTDGVNKATTVTNTDGSWSGYAPKIYWPNGNDSYYFRALATYSEENSTKTLTSVNGSFDAVQGTDLLWGTTSAHTGTEADGTTTHDYAEGAAINPRTGNVPMTFKHAMSKITVNLETSPTPADSPTPAEAVDLAGAKISIAYIYDNGKIALNDGKISSLAATSTIPISGFLAGNAISGEGSKLVDYVVIPQSLTTMNDGTTARNGAVAFYNKGELTTLNVDGDDKTYVTSTLEKVLYTAELANEKNATLPGAVSTSTTKPTEYYTKEEADEYNATLDGHVETGDTKYYTFEEFKALKNSDLTEALFGLLTIAQKAQHYTIAEYTQLSGNESVTQDAFDALSEEQKRKLYTLDEYKALAGKSETTQEQFDQLSIDEKTKCYTLDEYKALTPAFEPLKEYDEDSFNNLLASDDDKAKIQNGVHTAESVKEYNAKLTGAKKVGDAKPAANYTQEEANAYNATLPGAVKVGDFKEYKVVDSSKEAHPGDLKYTSVENPKIMMLIMLADGTTYNVDLATCKAYTEDSEGTKTEHDAISEWKRGEHYIYTISLAKEAVTFRAMIKDWDERKGGGNANLDWD